jgi:hypothetical protein
MKIKGITVWEQHVEKIALGVAALVLIGFAAMQFLGNPNEVKKGAVTFTPENVDEKLKEKAESIQRRLAPTAPPEINLGDSISTHADEYSQSLVGSIAPKPALAQVWPALAPPIGELMHAVSAYHVPKVPAPTNIAAQQYADALVDEVVTQQTDLAAKFPAKPYDIIWSTVFADFSIADLKKELAAGDPSSGPEGPRPIPSKWFNDRVAILDIVVQRQEQKPDGTWSGETELEPIPGQATLRPRLAEQLQMKDREEILELLADPVEHAKVYQPDFYDTRNNSWHPRVEQAEAEVAVDAAEDPKADEIRRLKKSISREQKKVDSMSAQVTALGGPCEDTDKPKPPAGGDDGAGGDKPPGGRGFGFGGSGAGRVQPGKSEEDRKKCIKLTKTLRELEKRLASYQAQLKELQPDAVVEEKPAEEASIDANAVDSILVWGHDITVEPGKTYRYRVAVRVYNPFFAKRNNLVESQKALADDFAMSSAMSEWSQPIAISPPLRLFLTNATPPRTQAGLPMAAGVGGLGLGTVTAEVYRFYDGRWWSFSFSAEPGDRIGGLHKERLPVAKAEPDTSGAAGAKPAEEPAAKPEEMEIDYGTDWFVLDVIENFDTPKNDLVRRGAAFVVLQNMVTGEVSTLRNPTREFADPERQRLSDLVKESEL